jgi:FKBP-type peptidyl-prolyl cis-trans isomerase
MMKYLHNICLVAGIFVLLGCNNSSNRHDDTDSVLFNKDASYAIGMSIGADLKYNMDMNRIVVNYDEFFKGIKDSITDKKTRFDLFEAEQIIEMAFSAFAESRTSEAIQKENSFLAENSQKPGVIVTPSGLQYEIIVETGREKPQATDTVRVHYEGRFIDGTIFDNSMQRGIPEEFPLFEVISGWTEGLQLMGVGSVYKLYVPSNLGYGADGGGRMPPYSTLIFEVELLDILN